MDGLKRDPKLQIEDLNLSLNVSLHLKLETKASSSIDCITQYRTRDLLVHKRRRRSTRPYMLNLAEVSESSSIARRDRTIIVEKSRRLFVHGARGGRQDEHIKCCDYAA
ncbi:hypothetical protein AKJ16_DCAP25814 [Drosera capensis]